MNFHVLNHLLLIYICKLHWNLNTMFICQVHFLLIYICNFHVLSHLLLFYICKLHWNLGINQEFALPLFDLVLTKLLTLVEMSCLVSACLFRALCNVIIKVTSKAFPLDSRQRYKLGLMLTRNCHNLTRIFTPGINSI